MCVDNNSVTAMIKIFNVLSVCVVLVIMGCNGSSLSHKDLTRVIVPRKSVQSADTILSRMGMGADRVDGIVVASSENELYIKDLTGEDTVVMPVVDSSDTDSLVQVKMEAVAVEVKNVDMESEIVDRVEPVVAPQIPRGGNYHVIVASFPNSELTEAERYVERLKSSSADAKLLKTENRVRVAYSSHPTMAAATAARDSLAATATKYKDCWVLKRTLQ